MSLFFSPFSWTLYSKKLKEKIENPLSPGRFTREDAEIRKMRLALGRAGRREEGNLVELYWLVDPQDGVIVDAKFQVFGESALIGAAEGASLLVVGKTYDQAGRISADLIDRHFRDSPDAEAFPVETRGHLNLVVEALEEAASACVDIPLPSGYSTPMPRDSATREMSGYPDFFAMQREGKLALIEEVLNAEIRPYIALDAGGIEVLDLIEHELIIAYKGSCTSCLSSIGTTLSSIQQILQTKIHPSLIVVPNMDDLHF